MTFRNVLAIAASGMLVASPLAASAATKSATAGTTAPAKASTNPCKGLHGDKLKECRQANKPAKKK